MLKWRGIMGGDGRLIDDEGRIISTDDAHDRIRRTIERTGKFILGSAHAPTVGEIAYFAGLPLRVVRHITATEAEADMKVTKDIWETDGSVDPSDSFFEVEVAD